MILTDAKMFALAQEVGRPIEAWDRTALVAALEELSGFKPRIFTNYKLLLMSYIRSKLPLEVANNLVPILQSIQYQDMDFVSAIKRSYFRSANDLKYSLDICIAGLVAENSSNPDMYLMGKVALYFAWAGMSFDDVLNVKMSDVSTLGDTVSHNNAQYQFTSGMASDIARYKDMTHSVVDATRRKISTRIVYNMADGEYYFRTIKSSQVSKTALRFHMSRLNNGKDILKRFNFEKVAESGRFYRVWEDEKEHGPFYQQVGENRWKITDDKRAANLLERGDSYTQAKLRFVFRFYRAYKQSVLDQ